MATKKTTTPEVYRQGDVLLVRVDSAPSDAKREPKTERVILAHGEVTGHAHAVPGADAFEVAKGAMRFLKVQRRTELRHEEHAPIPLKRGTYEVRIQSEYHPQAIRAVQD